METVNKKYNIEITVFSPLAIGAGAEKDFVRGIDFVVKDNRAYFLNMRKMVASGINPQELTTFFADKNEKGLLAKIGSKLNEVSDRSMPLPFNSDNDIKSFIKNELSGKPIIPGSSLKGAVRSVILDYLLNNVKPRNLNEKDYFGDSNKGDELMRFIKISDAEFEETALVNTKIFNLHNNNGNGWEGGWKHAFRGDRTNPATTTKFRPTGFNTIYEAVLPNEKSVCSIMLSEKDLFQKIDNIVINSLRQSISSNEMKFDEKSQKQLDNDRRTLKYKQETRPLKDELFSVKTLFSIINQHTKDYLDKEIAFFKKYSTDKTEEIVESLTAIKNQITADNSFCILKMSAGSGFHSITGDWQYDDYSKTGIAANGKQKYKSRKVAINGDDFSLMGFVKLRIMSDDEVAEYNKTLSEKKAQQEIDRQRLTEEKRIEREMEAERKRQWQDYNNLIFEAQNLFEENNFEQAKEKAGKAQNLLPNEKKHKELLQKISAELQKIKEQQERNTAILFAQQQADQQRLQANQVPLAEKIANTTKIPTLAGNIKTWMKLNNIEKLTEKDVVVVQVKVQEIYNSLKNNDKKNFSFKPIDEVIGAGKITIDTSKN